MASLSYSTLRLTEEEEKGVNYRRLGRFSTPPMANRLAALFIARRIRANIGLSFHSSNVDTVIVRVGGTQSLPVILGLQELKFVLYPVTRLCDGEFEAGLAGLVRRLRGVRNHIRPRR